MEVIADFIDAMSRFPTGVTIVSVRDELDDVAMTATAFGSISREPPLVGLGVDEGTHMHEVLTRRDDWAITVLGQQQRTLAGRFGASGRPSARLLLDDAAYHRGPHTGGLIVEDGVAALECRTIYRVPAGDHVVLLAQVLAIDYVSDQTPLVRFRRGYHPL